MIASRVGVLPPGWVFMIELATAVPFAGAIPTAGALEASHALLSEKNLIPQLTFICVAMTTFPTAFVASDHFEAAPQPPVQPLSASLSSIEADLS